ARDMAWKASRQADEGRPSVHPDPGPDPDETSSSGSSDSDSDCDSDSDPRSGSEDGLGGAAGSSRGRHQQEQPQATEGLTTVTGRPKPHIQRLPQSDLRARLSAFIPALRAANEELERQGDARDVRIELEDDDGDDEGGDGAEGTGDKQGRSRQQYIEMSLGLGVLEQKAAGTESSSSSSSEDERAAAEHGRSAGSTASGKPRTGEGVMSRLMGGKKGDKRSKPNIEEV
ncbi:hypothetical protein KEM52_002942, partial [Ascosphaera acerosa]